MIYPLLLIKVQCNTYLSYLEGFESCLVVFLINYLIIHDPSWPSLHKEIPLLLKCVFSNVHLPKNIQCGLHLDPINLSIIYIN